MLETFEVSKVLIIAPLRVARDTWPAEIEKWDHLQGLDISVIVGDIRIRNWHRRRTLTGSKTKTDERAYIANEISTFVE